MKPIHVVTMILLLLPLTWALADDNPCAECHEKIVTSMATSIHTRAGGVECQTCHPTAMNHMESGETDGLIPGNMQNTCFSCHTDLTCDGEHCSRDSFTCSNCHCVHHGHGRSMLKGKNVNALCESCHKDVRAEMNLPNHHPIPEGKMTCVSCHSPHGDFKPSEATGHDVNTLCYTCHADKEGPYVFEHEPVEEDCRICHNAHGTVADNLLVQTEPYLCLQCHEFHFHTAIQGPEDGTVNVGGTDFSNPHGTQGMKMAFGTKCTQCHSQVHGSDLPSQTTPGQGRALTR